MRRDVAFKNCLRIVKRVVMVTIAKEINILKAGPEVYYNFDDWYERHLKGTLLEDFMALYRIKREEIVELLIAIVNPLIA